MIERLRTFLRRNPQGIALASALDPLISSGTMFLVQGAVLLTTNKVTFAVYSLASSYMVMGQSVLSALFGGPLITLLSGVEERAARHRAGQAALRIQLLASLGIAALGLCAVAMLDIAFPLALLTSLGMIGLSFRDALRSVLAANLQLEVALAYALTFACATSVSLAAAYILIGQINPAVGLATLAVGALATLASPVYAAIISASRLPRDLVRKLGGMAAWSVPGAIVIWLQNSFYLTLVAKSLSMSAVGEVSAARMVAMPLLITASGLLRLAQVQAGRRVSSRGISYARSRALRLAIICLVTGFLAVSFLYFIGKSFDLGEKTGSYKNIVPLASTWLLFATVTTSRGLMSSLYQAVGRYREIFILNLIVLPFVLSGVFLLPQIIGVEGAILPMIIGEVALLVMLSSNKLEPRPSS